ncbi:transcriptional regulator [Streptomyces sp. NPDC005438]|uniref:transcriptional regulator n=1 Tax=Streptomyces sp. NPDC005438 TaxID=3156880 RepID=UPI0033B2339B
MEPNSQLNALIGESGMSRAGLASRVNRRGDQVGVTLRYDHTAVARWVKGQRPRGRVPELICEVLGERLSRTLTLDDIGMGASAPAVPPPTEGELRRFVERAPVLWRWDEPHPDQSGPPLLDGAAAVAPVWEWENPPEDVDVAHRGTCRVSPGDVTVLRAARAHYEQLYRNAGGVATRPRVVGFLTHSVAPLLAGEYDDATGRALHRASGSLAALTGVCAYDGDAQGLAQRYFHQALRLAKASGDRPFGGYVVALLVNQALFLGDHRRALACAEAALRAADGRVSPALATDLYVMQATAYAHLGDRRHAHDRMRVAEWHAGRLSDRDEPEEMGYVQPGLLEVRLAEALLVLGELGPAARYAERAAREPSHVRGTVNRLATLTDVEVRRDEPERAAATADRMVERARGMESQRLRGRMRAVRDRLAQHPASCAHAAAERIDDALRVPL